MATAFHYPTFRKKTEGYFNYLSRRKRDLVQLNGITGTELTQLEALYTALSAVATGTNWPKYTEAP